MLNPFEKTVELDRATVNSKKKELFKSMEEAETVFVPCSPGLTHRWRCKRAGFFITVDADFDHGYICLDVPLGVTISERDAEALLACATYYEVFKFQTGSLRPMLDDRPSAWESGAEIHLSSEHLIGAKDLDELVKEAAFKAQDARKGFAKIGEGSSLAKATAFDEEMRDFFRMLSDHLSDDYEDDD